MKNIFFLPNNSFLRVGTSLLAGFLAVFVASNVFAAGVILQTENTSVRPGDRFVVNVFLNTENEPVNAIEGNIVFPGALLEVSEVRDGNSVVNFWVKRPGINQQGSIEFSGVVPGGYNGKKGLLFSVVFLAKAEGNGSLEIAVAKALRNDGNGTALPMTLSSLSFSIAGTAGQAQVVAAKDSNPPESFTIEVSATPDMFDGKWFAVFATQDKGSGIERYEIREGYFGNYATATSPFLLQHQELDRKIFVKAVDKSGNERVETFLPPHAKPWYLNFWFIGIIMALAVIVVFLALKMLWPSFIKSR